MDKKKYNQKAMCDTIKNAKIALESISYIMSGVNDKALKKELKTQYEGYEKFVTEASVFISKNNYPCSKINPFQKGFMWCSIKMKTLGDDSKNHIADMMIKGSVMGINELRAMKNEGENLYPEVLEFVERLLNLEEEYEERLKAFL